MSEVKSSFSFNKVVSTKDVAKELVKKLNIDFSDSECRDLAQKIERENGLKCCWGEECACLSKDHIERLSLEPVKAIYVKKPYKSDELNLEKGEILSKGSNMSENHELDRIKNNFKDIRWIEKHSNSYSGFKIHLITDDMLKKVTSKFSEEYKLLYEYGAYFLKTTSLNTLMENWAFGKMYREIKGISKASKKYHISNAMAILEKFKSSKVSEPQNISMLNEFAESLVSQKAKTIEFGTDSVSAEFLLDWNKSSSYYNKHGVNSSSKDKLITLLTNTFYTMGTKYEPVQITSSWRSADDQARIMTDKLVEGSFLSIYKNVSEPYIDLIFGLYSKGELVSASQSYNKYFDTKCEELTKNYDEKISKFKNNSDLCRQLMKDIFTKGLCRPSYHQAGMAFDLSPKTMTVQKAESLHNGGTMNRPNYTHFTFT